MPERVVPSPGESILFRPHQECFEQMGDETICQVVILTPMLTAGQKHSWWRRGVLPPGPRKV